MKKPETQTHLISNRHLNKQKDSNQFHETGQLRRAKMHAAHLIEAIDNNKALNPSLHRLLEASLVLQTTNSKKLAAYLKRPPAMIRSEFQKIRTILGQMEDLQKVSSIRVRAVTKEFALSE